jgi:MFS family permease
MQLMNRLIRRTGIRDYRSGVWVAMAIQAIRTTGFSISFTYMPLYLYEQRHVTMTLVGSFLMISGVISGFVQIPGGMLADRFGHKKTFVIFQVADTLLFGVLAVLVGTNAAVWSIFLLSAAVTVVGGLSAPAISAVIADASDESRLTESFGLMAIGLSVGWAIGPLTGGYLQSLTSYAWVFGTGALVTSLSLVALPYLPKRGAATTRTGPRQKLSVFALDANLLVFCAICIFFYFEMGQWGSTLSIFTVDRIGFSPRQYGLLLSIASIIIVVFQYPISRRIEKLGLRTALFVGSLLYGAGFLSFAWVRSFLPAIGSIVILVAGEMLFVPASYAVVGRIARLEDRAKGMGLLGLCAATGSSFGPLLGGILLDRAPVGPLYLWGPVAVPAFVAAIGFVLWRGYARAQTTG